MGTGTLTDVAGGAVVTATTVNNIHAALEEDLVPRNGSGVATSLAGSVGTPTLPWNEGHFETVYVNGSDISADALKIQPNDIISGATRSGSEQPMFLDPVGAAGGLQFDILGATTDLIYDVQGGRYTLTADRTVNFLGAAPSSNNTCLVNDTDASDQDSTRTWGEFLAEKESIAIDTAGSEITSLVGSYQAFSITNGTDTEIFLAFIESSTELNKIKRGWFFDSSSAPIPRIVFSDGDTITLLALKWVFLNLDTSTVTVTATNPHWGATAPASPSSGDYWYDMANEIWKKYNGASWDNDNSTFIGMVVADTSDCIASRCVEFGKLFDIENSLEGFTISSSITVNSAYSFNRVSVNGKTLKFGITNPSWDITADLAGSADMYNATEQASTRYYLYMDETGDTIISDFEPYWRPDMLGFYHPNNPWRCLGYAYNNSSSNLIYTSWFSPFPQESETDIIESWSTTTMTLSSTTYQTAALGTFSPDKGSAIINNGSNQFLITKRGWYEVSVRLGGDKSGSASATFDGQIIRTGDSVQIYDFQDVTFTGNNTTPIANATWFAWVYFSHLDAQTTHEFQFRRVSGTTTWTVDKTSITIRRIKGIHV